MDTRKILALLLIVGGTLSLVYGGFSYTQATHQADIGPLHLQLTERERVNVPLWAGIAAVVGGGLLWAGVGKR